MTALLILFLGFIVWLGRQISKAPQVSDDFDENEEDRDEP